MKRFFLLSLALLLLAVPCAALAEGEEDVSFAEVLVDMYKAAQKPSAQTVSRLRKDRAATRDPVALAVGQRWEQIYVDPGYGLRLFGQDDPRGIPVRDKHAFVVLGYALQNGAMTGELKGRCDAAAAAARAFPDSLLVCTGGATGENNPDKHTEGGLMKEYLVDVCGLDPARIFTEELAMTTAENAVNVMAILQEQGVETLTVVTSHYHQRRGQILYAAMAARMQAEQGYTVEVVGDWSYLAPYDPGSDYVVAMYQLLEVLDLPDAQRELYYHLMYGD